MLFVFAVLLLMQPDLGTVIVMFATAVVLLFLAGAKLWQFIALMLTGLAAVGVLIFYSEYRWRRVTAFLRNPWADPFGQWLSADTILNGLWPGRLVWPRLG
ncbi:FtsW/RodA/SpoVE family cell cycle protein [Alishewanella longhuensis]